MGTQDWQTRVLEEGELQTLLASLGALEGLQVLERQVELRAEVAAAAELAAEQLVEPVSPDETPTSVTNPEPAPIAEPRQQQQATQTAPAAPPTAIPVTPAAPAAAQSGWVPTFANPVPPADWKAPAGDDSLAASTPIPLSVPETSVASSLSAEEDALVLEEQEQEAQSVASATVPLAGEAQNDDWVVALTEPEETSTPYEGSSEGSQSEVGKAGSKRAAHEVTGTRGIWSLLATWNGTGILLFLMAVGFSSALQGLTPASALIGGSSALVFIGIGFGIAAVAARRGRQPQSTISRAAFGVRGAAIPIIPVIIARYAATAVASVAVVFALRWFLPSVGDTMYVGTSAFGHWFYTFYILLGAVMVVATLLTILRAAARFVVTAVVAIATLLVAGYSLVVAFTANPGLLNNLGELNYEHALAVASVIIIFIGVVWGTTAADETPDLRSRLLAAKLLSAGLLNFTVLGSAAILAGYLFAQINDAIWRGALGVSIFGALVVLALSHQIRRSADSFRGFGLTKTSWWVVMLSSVAVLGAATVCHELVSQPVLVKSALSLLPVAGVPVVAWLAIIGMDVVIRREDYHEVSLLRDYGFYGKFRVANLIGWAFAVAIGFGFLTSEVPGFGWLGYLARLLPISVVGLEADTGVWLAFAVALLAPLFTIPRVRDQEAELVALQARHAELIDVAGIEND